jgi:hypothetical protein
MDDLRFYDFEFNLLDIRADFISVNHQVYYNKIGQFEAHFPIAKDLLELLSKNNYLVCVQGENAAIVTGWRAGDDVAVFGRSCNWLFTKRVLTTTETVSKKAEEIARGMVLSAFSDTDELVLGESLGDEKEVSIARDEPELLSDALFNCLSLAGLGNELVFDTDNKLWVYKTLKGKNLQVVLSESDRNMYGGEYSYDCLDHCQSAWYKKAPESEEGDSVWACYDGCDAKGIKRWECILSANTEDEARQGLLEKTRKGRASFGEASLLWRKDYELGDIVNLRIEKGDFIRVTSMRIVGVHSWYEVGDFGEQPIMEEVDNEL